ncbi:mucin-16-like [Megaptera novaeangliae]
MTITMQTGPSGTTSLGAPTMDTLATASLSGTYLAVTQGFPQSKITTQMSKGPEGVSWTNPPSVGETTSSSSLAPISDTTSSSHVLLTSQGQSTSSTLPVTSGLLPENFSLGKTRDMLRTSLETDTSLPPNLSSSSDEMLVTTDIEAIHPSTNTATTHVETTSCGHESHSPVLAHTQPSKATSSVVTSSTMWDITAPTAMSGSSETIKIERESVSSLNTGLRETSTYQETSSATETSTVISNVSTNDATTESGEDQRRIEYNLWISDHVTSKFE